LRHRQTILRLGGPRRSTARTPALLRDETRNFGAWILIPPANPAP